LYYRSEVLYQLEEQNDFINFFINELKSQEFYEKTSETFIQTVKIKAYANIENNLLKVSKDMKELRGLAISNLMRNFVVIIKSPTMIQEVRKVTKTTF
jgi:hypothetical protein